MKYLRKQISTEHNLVEGVIYNADAETVSYISPTSRDLPEYFTVYPLSDGTLTIEAYFKGKNLVSHTTFSPSDAITVYYLSSNSLWTPISFSDTLPKQVGHYITKTIPLVAGQPINLKSSTGLCVLATSTALFDQTPISNYYSGSITSDCPCIILGPLASLVTGTAYNGYWTQYDYAFRGLFRDWTSLIDASKLELPTSMDSRLSPDYTSLFENCSSLIAGPEVTWTSIDSNYTNFFKNCYSLGEIYTTITQASNSIITDWLKGTELGTRKMHVMEDFASYDAFNNELPSNWEIINDIEES